MSQENVQETTSNTWRFIYVCFPATGDRLDIGGPCPVGHFCPSGTSFPLGCPVGTYNNRTGQSNCTHCPAGYFCPGNITSYEGYLCPLGHYCPEGTRYYNEFPCPKGHYRNLTLGRSVSDCFACPGGYYCGGEGLPVPTDKCDAGRCILLGLPL